MEGQKNTLRGEYRSPPLEVAKGRTERYPQRNGEKSAKRSSLLKEKKKKGGTGDLYSRLNLAGKKRRIELGLDGKEKHRKGDKGRKLLPCLIERIMQGSGRRHLFGGLWTGNGQGR